MFLEMTYVDTMPHWVTLSVFQRRESGLKPAITSFRMHSYILIPFSKLKLGTRASLRHVACHHRRQAPDGTGVIVRKQQMFSPSYQGSDDISVWFCSSSLDVHTSNLHHISLLRRNRCKGLRHLDQQIRCVQSEDPADELDNFPGESIRIWTSGCVHGDSSKQWTDRLNQASWLIFHWMWFTRKFEPTYHVPYSLVFWLAT